MSNPEDTPSISGGPEGPETQPPPHTPEYVRFIAETEAAEDIGDTALEGTVAEPAGAEDLGKDKLGSLERPTEDQLKAYLESIGAPPATIEQIQKLLSSTRKDLIKEATRQAGLYGGLADRVADVLTWDEVRTRVEGLVALGLPNDKPTRDSVHELIMANRGPMKLPEIYARLAKLGIVNLHPDTEEENKQYLAVARALTEDTVALKKELISQKLLPENFQKLKDGEKVKLKQNAQRQAEQLSNLPAGDIKSLIISQLKQLGLTDEQQNRVFRPVKASDKFEELRRSHFGGWKEDGKYYFAYDIDRVAERIHIPAEVLKGAAEKGVSPEYLNQAKNNAVAGEHLRRMGIDWGAKPEAIADDGDFLKVTDVDLAIGSRISGRELTRDYVELAKTEYQQGNPFPAEYLASIGVNIVRERMEPPDPVINANAVGRRRTADVIKLSEEIEADAGAVSRSLRRPASLPLPEFMYDSPALRILITDRLNTAYAPFGKRILAWRVARRELKHRPIEIEELKERRHELGAIEEPTFEQTAELEELNGRIPRLEAREKSDLGLFRIGLPLYRETHNYIDTLDESVGSHQGQLSLVRRHKLHDINTAIINLSYRVYDARESLNKLRMLKINDYEDPLFLYNHELFKRQRNQFVQRYIKEAHAQLPKRR